MMTRRAALIAGLALALAAGARAQDVPRGRIVDDVKCAADPSQSYALYVPSTYSPERQWSVLFAFHPAANGRAMVAKYADAAERYGYIVAGSNNSRNGPWMVSAAAARAMPADVGRRFAIDPKRVYLTGFSGGARVAFQLALAGNAVAGIIASSAGLPDSKPRERLPFPLFGTAGTEDFNYIEMRMLDRELTTPHALAVFTGGHALPPDAVATQAIEWMELQAMTSGVRARDEGVIDRLLEARRSAIAASTAPVETLHLLVGLVADFRALRDVSAEAARLKDLRKRADVKKALGRERDSDSVEERTFATLFGLEAALANDEQRAEALERLRDELSSLARAANAREDSPARSRAWRILRRMTFGAAQRSQDRDYLALLNQFREVSRPPASPPVSISRAGAQRPRAPGRPADGREHLHMPGAP